MSYKYCFLVLLSFILESSVNPQKINGESDNALDKVIISKVLLKGYEKNGILVLQPSKEFNPYEYINKNKPWLSLFYNYLYSDFNLSREELKNIVNNYYYKITPSQKEKIDKVIFLTGGKYVTRNDIQDLRVDNNWSSVVTDLIILKNEKEGKCLVFYTLFDEGSMIAFLKKQNGEWIVTDQRTQMLE